MLELYESGLSEREDHCTHIRTAATSTQTRTITRQDSDHTLLWTFLRIDFDIKSPDHSEMTVSTNLLLLMPLLDFRKPAKRSGIF